MIRTIDNMNITKRNDFLRSFNALLELMEGKVWIDQQDQMDLDGDGDK